MVVILSTTFFKNLQFLNYLIYFLASPNIHIGLCINLNIKIPSKLHNVHSIVPSNNHRDNNNNAINDSIPSSLHTAVSKVIPPNTLLIFIMLFYGSGIDLSSSRRHPTALHRH